MLHVPTVSTMPRPTTLTAEPARESYGWALMIGKRRNVAFAELMSMMRCDSGIHAETSVVVADDGDDINTLRYP